MDVLGVTVRVVIGSALGGLETAVLAELIESGFTQILLRNQQSGQTALVGEATLEITMRSGPQKSEQDNSEGIEDVI
jgi:hypothetical protein